MDSFKKIIQFLIQGTPLAGDSELDPKQWWITVFILGVWVLITLVIVYSALHSHLVYADTSAGTLPGDDDSAKLKAAGTLLKILDTGIFKWGARVFAGLCIMSSAWALKEQRFGIAIICVIGAIIFGTAPKWVKDIFDIGNNESIFSRLETRPGIKPASIAEMDDEGANSYV
jgi:hypothetical protein